MTRSLRIAPLLGAGALALASRWPTPHRCRAPTPITPPAARQPPRRPRAANGARRRRCPTAAACAANGARRRCGASACWPPGPTSGSLHDGRARTPLEAAPWHDGEGAEARRRLLALPARDREALVAFLASL